MKTRITSPGSSIAISNIASHQKTQSKADLPEIENVSRKHSQNQSKPVLNDNCVTTIPVRQSSQSSLDQLLKETTEYLNKNYECISGAKIPTTDIQKPYSNSDQKLINGYKGRGDVVDGGKKCEDDYVERKTCLNVTCKFFGTPELDNYCSQCYRGRFENLAVDGVTRK